MDQSRFDDITRVLAAPSRRSLLGVVGAAVLAALLGRDEQEADAKPKKKKKCKKPKIKCGKKCVNSKTNSRHCGQCGLTCGSNACVDGLCQTGGCPKDQCGTRCVDFQDDEENCGGCGNVCDDEQTCENGDCVSSACGDGLRDCGAAGCRECCNSTDCCPPGRPNCLEADGNRARQCTAAGVCACPENLPRYGDVFGNGAPMCWLCLEDGHCLLNEPTDAADANAQGRHNCFFGNCVCPDSDPDLCRVFGAAPPRSHCTNVLNDETNCGFCGAIPCNAQIGQICINGGCTNPGPP